MPLFTVAIPTFNRAERLRETLEMLSHQSGFMDEDIEIVVSDNASSDNTGEVVATISTTTGKPIKYWKNQTNLGIDGNIDKVADLSSGQFILFMSDDDILRPNGFCQLRTLIHENPGLIFAFLNAGSFTGEYSEHEELKQIIPLDQTLATRSADKLVTELWIWSTFVSSFFVERGAWISVRNRKDFIGTDIYLTHVLFRLLVAAPDRLKLITATQLVAARAEYTGSFRILHAFAQSFMELICVDAIRLGYSESSMRKIKLRTIRSGLPSLVMMVRRGSTKRSLTVGDYVNIFKFTWKEPTAWLFLAPVVFVPMPLINIARKVRRTLLDFRRAA